MRVANFLMLTVSLGLLTSAPQRVVAQTPRTISYQGQILEGGMSAKGSVEMSFELLASGKTLWTEEQSVDIASDGVFSVILGDANPISLPFDQPYSLKLKVIKDGTTVIQTQPFGLTSVPHAFTAQRLDVNPKLTELSDVSKNSAPLQDQVLRWKDGQWVFEHITGVGNGVNSVNNTTGNVTLVEGLGIKIQTGANGSFTFLIDTAALPKAPIVLGDPVGTVCAFAGNPSSLPAGWLLCNGDTINQSDYPDLFQVIGKDHIYGNAPTNKFSLPDYRGLFLRGTDLGAGLDLDSSSRSAMRGRSGANSGARVGSVQSDTLQSHQHHLGLRRGFVENQNTGLYVWTPHQDLFPSVASPLTGGNETRPKNAYVHWIIKAKK